MYKETRITTLFSKRWSPVHSASVTTSRATWTRVCCVRAPTTASVCAASAAARLTTPAPPASASRIRRLADHLVWTALLSIFLVVSFRPIFVLSNCYRVHVSENSSFLFFYAVNMELKFAIFVAENNEICSGNGQCVCGQCMCNSDDDRHYSGKYCEKCPVSIQKYYKIDNISWLVVEFAQIWESRILSKHSQSNVTSRH